ncbi:unnamed protein product [Spirodela intermedia]|uniref:Uncharacterized protein n=1 Tax=Spirodela intermedia TaxID=51605 RepID=A0A7I8LA94_SPIIN|nr:unnamed protein product [Spirodela intermedia]
MIPSEMGNFSRLSILQLHLNQFFGQIPPELGQCRNLTLLMLYSNRFTGRLPTSLGNWYTWKCCGCLTTGCRQRSLRYPSSGR